MNLLHRRIVFSVLCLSVCVSLVGCGDKKVGFTVKGKVVQGGQTLVPNDKVKLRVTLNELKPDGVTLGEGSIPTVINDDGTFEADVPAGKYRVQVEYGTYPGDDFKGKYSQTGSPIVEEITGATEDLVIEVSM